MDAIKKLFIFVVALTSINATYIVKRSGLTGPTGAGTYLVKQSGLNGDLTVARTPLSFDSVLVKKNDSWDLLSVTDTIFWKDSLKLRYQRDSTVNSFDSFKIADSLCQIVSQNDTAAIVVVDSGLAAEFVMFILTDGITTDTCSNPDSVWLAAEYRPSGVLPPTITSVQLRKKSSMDSRGSFTNRRTKWRRL